MGPLKSLFSGSLQFREDSFTVSFLFEDRGLWKFDCIFFELANYITNTITAISISQMSYVQDSIIWKANTKGQFSLKSSVHLLGIEKYKDVTKEDISCVWKVLANSRVQHFLWVAY